MSSKPAPKPGCPCVLNSGWDYSEPDNPRWCDHGALAAAVAAAEEADRLRAERLEQSGRFCPRHSDGWGPCRCPS